MMLAPPDFLVPMLAKPIAIFGGGVSGDGVRALAAALGAETKVYDAKGAKFTTAAARQHALAVFSPGFVPDHPWLAEARAAGIECLSELDFAALLWRGQVVAITGTNGKTTLTEFLTHALRGLGRDASATGNIGQPFSGLVAEKRGATKQAVAICEVSSFQAETLRHFRADTTLWTNFAEDHLERHPGLESYFSAKWNLVTRTADRRTSATVFVGSSVQRFAQKYARPLAATVAVATENQATEPRLDGTVFAAYPQRENFLLALAWWRAEGLDDAALYAAARSFRLGRHRLARVAEHEGVTYWNDSKATNFHAVEAALAGLAEPAIVILGGKSKGGDLAAFVHRISPRVRHAVLLGETSGELAFHCKAFRVAHTACGSLAEAVRRAAEVASAGDQVLLSPGFASFDMFRNYEDRGIQFENLVRDLALDERSRTGVSPASLR